MGWPTGNDYNEAVQSPKLAFADADLRSGMVECNQLGLPKPRTGAFATVYRFANGPKAWAVRCFNREVKDQQHRYLAITEHLSRNPLPYTVGFSFINAGIKIKGVPYPILKMEWVSGDPLHIYVERHINDSRRLQDLAKNWMDMSLALQKAGIAHGDLQHGNVLVVGSSLKLVDYDGMYVPSLSGHFSNETGQPNYQLPQRTALHYGPYLDYFSEWVILISLLALSIDSSLWRNFGGGDECLLFRRRDFEAPDQSALFRSLERHPNSQLAALVGLLKTFLFLAPATVPPLDAAAMPNFATSAVTVTSSGSGADWISDHLPKRTGPEQKSVETQDDLPFGQSSWILDFTAPPATPIEFREDLLSLRVISWAGILLSLTCTLIFSGALSLAAAAFGLALIGALLRRAYAARPELAEFQVSRAAVEQAARELQSCTDEMHKFDAIRQQLRHDEGAEKKEVERRRTLLLSEHQKSEKRIRDRHAATTGPLRQQVQQASGNETAELTALQKGLGSKVTDLQNRIAAAAQAEANELASKLKAVQDAYVNAALSSAWIATAQIDNIGDTYTLRLEKYGFRTAADIDYYAVQRVPGIKTTRAKALADWRLNLENAAKHRMPKKLKADEQQQIKNKYASLRQGLIGELHRSEQQLLLSQESIRQKHAAIRTPLEATIASGEVALQRELGILVADFRRHQSQLLDEDVQATAKSDAAVAKVAKDMDGCTRQLAAVQWRKGKLQREHQRYAHLTFGHFARRVMIGR